MASTTWTASAHPADEPVRQRLLAAEALDLSALARHGMLAVQKAAVLLFAVVAFGLRVGDPFLLAATVIS